MKAVIWTHYGPPEVLQLAEIAKPVPGDNQVLIKIHAATVSAGDCEMRSMTLPAWVRLPMRLYVGYRRPRRKTTLGQELAGEVEAVGKEVSRFAVGDPVFAQTGFAFGACAEYICLPEDGAIALKPANMTYEEAAAVPTGGLEALHFLTKAALQPGETILINGAGGSIGTFAVQLARHCGAEVTAVDSALKLEMLRAIGADHVIDYAREDFTSNGQTYDVIFDVVGKSSFSGSIASLKKNGRYLVANPSLSLLLRGQWTSRTSDKRVILEMTSQASEDLVVLRELIEADKLRSVIDRRYPLAQTAEAHRYVETGNKAGNVIIQVIAGRTE